MAWRPIVLKEWEVKALLAGIKRSHRVPLPLPLSQSGPDSPEPCLRIAPTDSFFIRETWCIDPGGVLVYRASATDATPRRWRSAHSMPQTASRIAVAVTHARAQRIGDISVEDAREEGWADAANGDALAQMRSGWMAYHGADAWSPFAWVRVLHLHVLRVREHPRVNPLAANPRAA